MLSPWLCITFFSTFCFEIIIYSQEVAPQNVERSHVLITQFPAVVVTSCIIIAQHQNQEISVDTMHKAIQIAPVLHALVCVCVCVCVCMRACCFLNPFTL